MIDTAVSAQGDKLYREAQEAAYAVAMATDDDVRNFHMDILNQAYDEFVDLEFPGTKALDIRQQTIDMITRAKQGYPIGMI